MKRIIIHWTAGANKPSALDLSHYHYVIDGEGKVHEGKWPVSANAGALIKGQYAAHTLNCNTGSIGVSLAAMAGAVERPFSAGKSPITNAQESTLTRLLVDLCDEYKIPVTRQTVLTHAEVEPTLGIKQKGKWDICWLPGMASPRPAVEVGDIIRSRLTTKVPAPKPSLWDLILKLLGMKK